MKQTVSKEKLQYIAGNRTIGFCYVDVYVADNGQRIVVVTEPEDNTGASITNAIERVAEQLVNAGHDFNVLIEHYDIFDEETWDRVEFETRFRNPKWIHLTKEQFNELIAGATMPDIILLPDGSVKNLEQLVIHHSPTGFAWGYEGSGPADLAMNIIEKYLRSIGFAGKKIKVWRGECFELTFNVYQYYKKEVIANIPQNEGATITAQSIKDWLNKYGIETQNIEESNTK